MIRGTPRFPHPFGPGIRGEMTRALRCLRGAVVAAILWVSLGAAAAERPRLGVLVIVDQFPSAQFSARLPTAQGGFARIAREGFRFREALYESAPTLTAPGHATLSSGTQPRTHGVVGNHFFDPAMGRVVYAVEDERHQVLGRGPAAGDGTSPARLRAGTLGESIKAAGGKVVGVSGKDRATILMVGPSADVALWLDRQRPVFTSSTWYARALPSWISPINERIGKAFASQLQWSLPRGGITGRNPPPVPPPYGTAREGADPVPSLAEPSQLSARLAAQPLLDELVVDIALAAVERERLGKDGAPDLLAIGFSSADFVGHSYGAESPEAENTFRSIDAQLGRLLDGLDRLVGAGRYVVAVSGDHGAPLPPDLLSRRGIRSGAVDIGGLAAALDQEADAALGAGDWFTPADAPGFFVPAQAREKVAAIAGRLRSVARRFEGVVDLVPRDELATGGYGALGDLYRRGLDRDRSPDFILLVRAYWSVERRDRAGHGSAHLYDRSVPLMFFGAGVRRGAGGTARAVDLAPTLAHLLGVSPPADVEGVVLDRVARFDKSTGAGR